MKEERPKSTFERIGDEVLMVLGFLYLLLLLGCPSLW